MPRRRSEASSDGAALGRQDEVAQLPPLPQERQLRQVRGEPVGVVVIDPLGDPHGARQHEVGRPARERRVEGAVSDLAQVEARAARIEDRGGVVAVLAPRGQHARVGDPQQARGAEAARGHVAEGEAEPAGLVGQIPRARHAARQRRRRGSGGVDLVASTPRAGALGGAHMADPAPAQQARRDPRGGERLARPLRPPAQAPACAAAKPPGRGLGARDVERARRHAARLPGRASACSSSA